MGETELERLQGQVEFNTIRGGERWESLLSCSALEIAAGDGDDKAKLAYAVTALGFGVCGGQVFYPRSRDIRQV